MERRHFRAEAWSSKGCVVNYPCPPLSCRIAHPPPLTTQIAHPPPRRDGKRSHFADLNGAEIATANLARNGKYTDLLVEHDAAGGVVGSVLASWEGRNGELRVHGKILDPDTQASVRSGQMRQLSLGTSVHSHADTGVLYRSHDEVSLCETAARPGCIVTDIDGQAVGSSHRFAKPRGGPR